MLSRAVSIFLTFSLCARLGPLLSQSPLSLTYTISDGMPMTEVSVVHCDREGRIWSVYNNATVSGFDGRKFSTYGPEITGHYFGGGHFAEDRHGMWLWNLRQSISLYTDGTWKSWNSPGFCSAVVDKKEDRLITVDTMGVLFIFDAEKGAWVPIAQVPVEVRKQGLQYELHSSLNEERYLLKVIDIQSHSCLVAYTTTSLIGPVWIQDLSLRDAIFFWREGKLSTYLPNTQFSAFRDERTGNTYRYAFRIQDKLVVYNNTLVAQPNTWKITLSVLETSGQIHQLFEFFHTHAEVSLAQDRQGHIWVASQVGLTVLYPELLTCHEDDPNMVSNLHVINEDAQGRIWFGGYTSGLCYYDGIALRPAPADARQYVRFLPGALRTSEGTMGFWTEDYGVVVYENGRWKHSKARVVNPLGDRGYYLLQLRNGMCAAGLMDDGLGISHQSLSPDIEWTKISKTKGLLLDNVLTISEDQKGRLWTGRSTQGIALYDPALNTAKTWLRSDDPEKGFGAMSSTIDSDGDLWLGGHDGLYFIEKPSEFDFFRDNVFEVAQKVDMAEAGSTQVSLLKEYRGHLIFGNKHGYGFLDLKSYNVHPVMPRICFYPTDLFLKSCDQNTILVDSRGDIWIGQDLGATRIDFDKLKFDTLPVSVIIDSVLANGEKVATVTNDARGVCLSSGQANSIERRKVAGPQSLPILKRHLEIFVSPSFTGLLNDNVGYQYRLGHKNIQDTTWSAYSRDDRIVFTYLPPGKNKIEIRAIKNNQPADTVILNYHVPRALSENPLFWICLIGGLSTAGAIVLWRSYRQQLSIKQTRLALKEKELAFSLQEREKEQLQIKAIANALNPHFINNSLQWLQSRVRKDAEAVRMIDRFSKNIHTVFINSRQGKAYHSLVDEMELVKNYLYIQKSRYGDFVDVTLPSEEMIASFTKLQVPLMQIQIHVENAIEHGLRHRPGARKLDVNMEESGSYLHIHITDDGIGRYRSQEIGTHGTQQGTAMLKSLHAIFNKYNPIPILSSYQDTPFTDPETGEHYGTIVHIGIPKEYNYAITEN